MNFLSHKNGITLIALVITIIVLLILAGVSLSATIGNNGIVEQAQNANLTQKFAKYKEELEMGLTKNLTVAGSEMKTYIQTISDEDVNKFIIVDSELMYIGDDEKEKNAANGIGINTSFANSSSFKVEDIQNIINKVLVLNKSIELPADDDVATELAGIRLYDKNSQNGDRWKIIIDYNENNQETARYGSGYYLLKTGETYNVNDESLQFSSDFVINYAKNTIAGLSERATEWSLDTTIAVTSGLVLNIDPTNLADGNWTGITKYGDVTYDSTSKALVFNESESNTKGEGGYLKLTRSGVDFTNGFTFEIYANLSRLRYDNGSGSSYLGLFCRIPTLSSNCRLAMRFGYTVSAYWGNTICKFNDSSSWIGAGSILETSKWGDIVNYTDSGYSINEDFYLTFVYRAYDSTKEDNNYDDYMKENNVDKVEYYINGELYGYTYYGHDSYIDGLNIWNNDSCPFFVGVCPWSADGNLYYLKGKVYTTRLYTCSMSADKVKENMEMTQRYRSSF
jgi:hypothetical protein